MGVATPGAKAAPAWPVREGWDPWVVAHLRACAAELVIDIEHVLRRGKCSRRENGGGNGALSFQPTRERLALAARRRLIYAARTMPFRRTGAIPSFPQLSKAMGMGHGSVVEAFFAERKRRYRAGEGVRG